MDFARLLAVRLRIPLLLLAIMIGFYWKLTLTDQYTWLSAPDFSNQLMPWYQFQAGEWHAGRIPLWTPYEWAGQSLIGQAQPGVVDPLNLLMYWAPLKKGWIRQETYHWLYVLGHFLAALTFYFFCRTLGCSRVASLAAGCGYSLTGIPGSTEWPQMFHAAIWGPAALAFLFRAGQGIAPVRNGIYSGALLGLAWLSGHHQIPVFFTYASAAFWLFFVWRAWREDRGLARRLALAAVVWGTMMIAVGGAQIAPAYEYGKRSIRWGGAAEAQRWDEKVPYYVHEQFSGRASSLIGLIVPTDTHYQPYKGVTICFLGFLGAAAAWNDRRARWLAALGVFGLLFAMGKHTPLQGLLYATAPLVEKARVPAMALVLFDVAAAALAAFAIDRFRESEWTPKFGAATGIFAGAAMFAAFILFGHKWVPAETDALWVYCALSGAAIWALSRARPAWAGVALLGLILYDAGLVTGAHWANHTNPATQSFVRPMSEQQDLIAFFRTRPDSPRIEYDDKALPYNFGDWWGVESYTSYTASAPWSLFRHDAFSEKTHTLLGIRYLVAHKPRGEYQIERFTTLTGLKVFENPKAFGRIFLVHDVRRADDEDHAHKLVQGRAIDIATTSFVIGEPPKLESCSGDAPPEFARRMPGRVRITVEAGCRAMLVLTDLYDPGWEATVDGKPAKVWEAYAMVQGVVVERGKHTVELRYRPASFRYGVWMTALGALAVVGTWLRARRIKDEPQPEATSSAV